MGALEQKKIESEKRAEKKKDCKCFHEGVILWNSRSSAALNARARYRAPALQERRPPPSSPSFPILSTLTSIFSPSSFSFASTTFNSHPFHKSHPYSHSPHHPLQIHTLKSHNPHK